MKWYNDVIFFVSDECIVELAKPFLINTIHKGMMKRKDGVVCAEDTSPMAPPTTM